MQDKLQKQKEAEARKFAAQEAKQAKQAERQLRSNIKQARQLKKSQNNIILGTEEVDLEAVDGAEASSSSSWCTPSAAKIDASKAARLQIIA